MRLCFIFFVTFFRLFTFCLLSHSPSTSVPIYGAAVCHWSFIAPDGLLSVQVLSLFISLTFLPFGIFFYPVDEDTKFSPKRWHLSTNLHGPTSHKAVICTVTTVRASNNTGILCVTPPFIYYYYHHHHHHHLLYAGYLYLYSWNKLCP